MDNMVQPAKLMGSCDDDALPDVFGRQVFHLGVMRQRLPKDVFRRLRKTIEDSESLDPDIADIVANAMKDWALEQGATHYCHWFQPLTGLTAEKHDSFISPNAQGEILMEFSGKELIQGEPDASSFPSGGLRGGFEARGYTIWDCTSPVFVKHDGTNRTLFIPSAFCSYTGRALDYKTPVLRGKQALNRQALRILRALGDTQTQQVIATLGAEQEYFLIDREYVEQRLDLAQTGRTLFGAPSPKGMAMSVHYFGSVHERVAAFMNELNTELWKLGVSAKTQHNEISPCQYEIAPVFGTINVAADHNQLTMEALQKVAERHDMECLLHEKPFATFGGSGKHCNWSMATDRGQNLLEPGTTPHENEVFLIFLCAVIKAVDKYAPVLRASVADAGNDHRLGAMEAPPAIMSIFVGDQLNLVLKQLSNGGAKATHEVGDIELGVSTIPPLPKDVTDRNRTSPFAFTGNKFEFRTPGSALNTAKPAFVLCAIVADVLAEIADELEKASDVNKTTQEILRQIVREHGRVIFNGDNYTQEWVDEAAKRGLPNLPDTVTAFKAIQDESFVSLFDRHQVLCPEEYHSRIESAFQHYAQAVLIEGRTALRMVEREILPTAMMYSARLAEAVRAVGDAGGTTTTHRAALDELCSLIDRLGDQTAQLRKQVDAAEAIESADRRAEAARDTVRSSLAQMREVVDRLEMVVDAELWPLPTYAEMVFKR